MYDNQSITIVVLIEILLFAFITKKELEYY